MTHALWYIWIFFFRQPDNLCLLAILNHCHCNIANIIMTLNHIISILKFYFLLFLSKVILLLKFLISNLLSYMYFPFHHKHPNSNFLSTTLKFQDSKFCVHHLSSAQLSIQWCSVDTVLFVCLLLLSFGFAILCCMWDLSSPNRAQTDTPCTGSVESLGRQGRTDTGWTYFNNIKWDGNKR